MTSHITDLLINKVTQNPKVTSSSINYTTQFITNVVMEEASKAQYENLYSKAETLCKQKGEILKLSEEMKGIEEFLNSEPKNIVFLIESLIGKSAICALEIYNLYYQDQNEKLLDYTDIENSAVLTKVYLENGGNIYSFALTTAIHFFQNTELEF